MVIEFEKTVFKITRTKLWSVQLNLRYQEKSNKDRNREEPKLNSGRLRSSSFFGAFNYLISKIKCRGILSLFLAYANFAGLFYP